MRVLNLPEFNYQVKKSEGKVWIFDVIRKKYVMLTPEEWVRQHLIHYFSTHRGYPQSLMKIESGLQFNSLQKRSDIVIYDRSGKPWMIAECKSSEVDLDQRSAQQVAVYNKSIQAPYVVLSNGMKHVCYQMRDGGEIIQLDDFPQFPG